MKILFRVLLILVPVAIGVGAVVLAPKLKTGPETAKVEERAVKARIVKVSKLDVLPRVVGYGVTGPARTWNAVADVAGHVVWMAPELKTGKIVPAETPLLRIDDSGYRLSLALVEAQIEASVVKDKTTKASLEIARRDLALLREDMKRKEALVAKGATSRATLDAAQRQVLSGESQIQNLEGTLAINRAERKVQETQRDLAKLDLQHTRIGAPYDVRITEIDVDLAMYVNKGQRLFATDDIAAAEVEAKFALGKLRPLIAGRRDIVNGGGEFLQGAVGLRAVVRLKTESHTVQWDAVVDRVAGIIDPQTQSAGVVVKIEEPYRKARPGERPPLTRGTFVEVELRGNRFADQIVIPANAIHQGTVYVMDEDHRLQIRPVRVRFTQGGAAVVEKGLKPGENLVVSDLVPAVAGMLLDGMPDQKTKMKLVFDATGETPKNKGGQAEVAP